MPNLSVSFLSTKSPDESKANFQREIASVPLEFEPVKNPIRILGYLRDEDGFPQIDVEISEIRVELKNYLFNDTDLNIENYRSDIDFTIWPDTVFQGDLCRLVYQLMRIVFFMDDHAVVYYHDCPQNTEKYISLSERLKEIESLEKWREKASLIAHHYG